MPSHSRPVATEERTHTDDDTEPPSEDSADADEQRDGESPKTLAEIIDAYAS